jgi:hypothetical protein
MRHAADSTQGERTSSARRSPRPSAQLRSPSRASSRSASSAPQNWPGHVTPRARAVRDPREGVEVKTGGAGQTAWLVPRDPDVESSDRGRRIADSMARIQMRSTLRNCSCCPPLPGLLDAPSAHQVPDAYPKLARRAAHRQRQHLHGLAGLSSDGRIQPFGQSHQLGRVASWSQLASHSTLLGCIHPLCPRFSSPLTLSHWRRGRGSIERLLQRGDSRVSDQLARVVCEDAALLFDALL